MYSFVLKIKHDIIIRCDNNSKLINSTFIVGLKLKCHLWVASFINICIYRVMFFTYIYSEC